MVLLITNMWRDVSPRMDQETLRSVAEKIIGCKVWYHDDPAGATVGTIQHAQVSGDHISLTIELDPDAVIDLADLPKHWQISR